MAAIDARLTAPTRPIVKLCLEHAPTAPSVERIAARVGVSRKTVALRLAVDRLPPASELVGWGRMLFAGRLLEDMGRPVEQIAFALGFQSGTALRHMLQRYTGLRAAQVRAQGGYKAVLPIFVASLASSAAPALAAAGAHHQRVTLCHDW